MSKNIYDPVPYPQSDPTSIQACLMAIKQNLDILTGVTDISAAGGAVTQTPNVYIQRTPPLVGNANQGDFWLNTTNNTMFILVNGLITGNIGAVVSNTPKAPVWLSIHAPDPIGVDQAQNVNMATHGGQN